VTIIAFWKKREVQKTPESERIIPLPNLSPSTLDAPPATSAEAVKTARESLKVLKLERQILGSAVTTIYECHSKGVISEAERDRMLEKYKVDLKRLEKGIEENQQIVDLHDLEVEREALIKSFKAKLAEIDAKLKGLKSGTPIQKANKGSVEAERRESNERKQPVEEEASNSDPDQQADQQAASDSENRIDQIREEILKAMDRLEQIETEG
jgi:uncharacterized protein YceH (UPF0502 family)